YGGKPPFVALVEKAAVEKGILVGLEKIKLTNGWQEIQKKLDEPASKAYASKRSFDDLRRWSADAAKDEKAKQIDITAGDRQFQILLVEFNVQTPTDNYITAVEAR